MRGEGGATAGAPPNAISASPVPEAAGPLVPAPVDSPPGAPIAGEEVDGAVARHPGISHRDGTAGDVAPGDAAGGTGWDTPGAAGRGGDDGRVCARGAGVRGTSWLTGVLATP